jgi:DNA-binding response OmpR family regulator
MLQESPYHLECLIIWDDEDVFEVISMVLESQWSDIIISHSPSGALGVQMAGTEEPQVILLYLGLPDTDRFEVCSRISRRYIVTIVMLTVRDGSDDIMRGFAVGANDYVTKPFRPVGLVSRINAILRRVEISRQGERDIRPKQRRTAIDCM